MKINLNLSKGVIMTLVSFVLVVVSSIVYGVNVSRAGYFQGASVGNMVLLEVLTMCALCLAACAAQLETQGIVHSIVDCAGSLFKIAACAMLALALIRLVGARVEGLGFIYFSNPDVILEVQTPANLASARGTICNIVMLSITLIVSIVSTFFNMKKEA